MLNKIKKFAPVLIITLNRDEHFINCVNSLSACMHADKTDLYIALDYPSKENHWEGYNKILEYLPTITGFNSVNVIRREHNYGIEKNYFDAVDFVFEKYDRLIFSEDDNLFSDDFLNFMSSSLDVYKDRADVFSVSGYNYPIDTSAIKDRGNFNVREFIDKYGLTPLAGASMMVSATAYRVVHKLRTP